MTILILGFFYLQYHWNQVIERVVKESVEPIVKAKGVITLEERKNN
ncbi:hypothetical protein LEP1GSC170_2920 [Leptospira interrogans serovar Bataviae str. HAI135]|nr:hypothetical protein LEP1GSC170_2920 [Leptospira interrogans serovar Bataviae str. HAI135]